MIDHDSGKEGSTVTESSNPAAESPLSNSHPNDMDTWVEFADTCQSMPNWLHAIDRMSRQRVGGKRHRDRHG